MSPNAEVIKCVRSYRKRKAGEIRPFEFQQESLGLAVPTASEASAMEAATHAMAPKTSNMCDTHTVCEAAPAEMSGTKAAIHTYGATHAMTETVTSEMGGTY